MTSLNAQNVSILLFGQDERLVETRCWVLEKAGFQVQMALSLPDLSEAGKERSIDLFLLCDSLRPEARSSALALIHSTWPGAKRLLLMPYHSSAEFQPHEEVFFATEGPGKLVATIRTLIANGPVSAA